MLASECANQSDYHAGQAEMILSDPDDFPGRLEAAQVHATLSLAYAQRLLTEIEVLRG